MRLSFFIFPESKKLKNIKLRRSVKVSGAGNVCPMSSGAKPAAVLLTANEQLAAIEAQSSVWSDIPMPQPLLPSYSAPQRDSTQLRDQLQFAHVLI